MRNDKIGDYVFIDVSDGVTMTPKIDHAVKRPYQALGQGQRTELLSSKQLVGLIESDRIAPASRLGQLFYWTFTKPSTVPSSAIVYCSK